MAVIKYKNPKYTEGGSEPKYIVIPTLTMENDEVYVGTTEPTEGEKIWVNPSNGLTKYKNGESWEDLVQQIDFGKGDGTKALMDNGQYVSTVLESNKNILRRVNIGTLTLTVGTNDSVNITNSNTLNSINPFEWFIITCNLNGSDTYLYSYNDSEGIKCFRHYTNQDNNRSVAFIITNINTVNNTCSIEYNDNNLVTNKNISNYTLTKTNTTEYTPTSDYNPATKKYVDDYNLMPKSDSQIVHTPSAGSFDKKYTVDDNDGKFSKVTILGNDDLPYDSFIILNDLSAYNIGDIVYTNIYKEDNDTIKYTVFATRDSFSISFELIECFYEGINSVTTLVNLPATKRSIVATVTAATSLSLASNLELGQELYIRIYNNSSSAITQPIPNSGNFVSMNGTSVSIPSKSFIEMSIWCYESGKYSIRIGEIA